jgi:hypothetical protein
MKVQAEVNIMVWFGRIYFFWLTFLATQAKYVRAKNSANDAGILALGATIVMMLAGPIDIRSFGDFVCFLQKIGIAACNARAALPDFHSSV